MSYLDWWELWWFCLWTARVVISSGKDEDAGYRILHGAPLQFPSISWRFQIHPWLEFGFCTSFIILNRLLRRLDITPWRVGDPWAADPLACRGPGCCEYMQYLSWTTFLQIVNENHLAPIGHHSHERTSMSFRLSWSEYWNILTFPRFRLQEIN